MGCWAQVNHPDHTHSAQNKEVSQSRCRTVENVKLWQRLRQRSSVWHLATSDDLDHQRLLNRLKLSTHHNLVVVALLDYELQAVLLSCTHNASVIAIF